MLTDPNQPKKKPIVVKDLPFDLPTFEAQRYTPAAAQPNLTRLGYSLARTVATAKQALATPTPPKRGTPPASKATPRPVQAPTPSPTRTTAAAAPLQSPVRYALPEYMPNMSTASGPVYAAPPAMGSNVLPSANLSTPTGSAYAPPPASFGPQPQQRPYLPMIERAAPQVEAWAPGRLPMSYPQPGTTDFFTGQAVQPNMSTPYGPVYVSPYSQLLNAGIAEPQPYTPAEQQAAQPPATPAQDKKAGRQRYGSRGGSGYYPSRYYGGGSYGGGGGGGANAADYERYGISQPWMEAYKAFWGQDMPTNMWGLYNQLVELFARYAGRMPQLSDWQSIWQSIKADYTARGVDFPNPYSRLEMYEPLMEKFAPQPTVQLPTVSYGPGLSF